MSATPTPCRVLGSRRGLGPECLQQSQCCRYSHVLPQHSPKRPRTGRAAPRAHITFSFSMVSLSDFRRAVCSRSWAAGLAAAAGKEVQSRGGHSGPLHPNQPGVGGRDAVLPPPAPDQTHLSSAV